MDNRETGEDWRWENKLNEVPLENSTESRRQNQADPEIREWGSQVTKPSHAGKGNEPGQTITLGLPFSS